MIETFHIFYEDEGGWVFQNEVKDTLINVLAQVYNYPDNKKYRLEKITLLGNQVINFE